MNTVLEPLTRSPRDRRPLAVQVYEQVRDLIVERKVAPDTVLIQEQIADSLGVSRTPVRDALNRLTHDGLVTWIPGNGYIVNEVNAATVREVYTLRCLLEQYAAGEACGKHTPAQLAHLRSLCDELAHSGPAEPGTSQFELNRDFHCALIQPCGNQLLIQMIEDLWAHPVNRVIARSYVDDAESLKVTVAEHRAMVAAAAAGATRELTELVSLHWASLSDTAAQAS